MAAAEDAPPANSATAPIIVTVERPVANANASAQQATIDAAQLNTFGTTALDQVLQSIPSLGFQGVGAYNAAGFGVYFVDLRSLNFNRTLTLVDGKRFVVSGIRTDEAVDLNNVPLAMIDHIDVLPTGSQPVYGADAVAGVVNVVLRKNFDGVLVNAYGGGAVHGGDGTGEINATWGHNFDRGNVTVNLGYFTRGAIAQRTRSSAANPITSATIEPDGSVSKIIGIPATPGGHAVSADGSIDANFTASDRYAPFNAATDSYNFGDVQDLQGSLKRETANIMGHYEITPDITASGQFLFSQKQSDFAQAPQVLGLAGTFKHPEGFVVPVGSGGNPFDQPVGMQRVLDEVGNIDNAAEGSTWRLIAELAGTSGKIDWSLSYNRGVSTTTYKLGNSVNLTRAIELASCVPGSGCESANFFGPGSLTAADADALRFTDTSKSQYTEDVAQAMARTDLAQLPGGALTATIGGELRHESGYTHLDPVVLAGDQASPDSSNTQGAYSSQEVYLDVNWPLLANRKGVSELTVDTAVRYSHFDPFGSFPTWRVSGIYAPNKDIRLRMAAGLARRPPAITEAFAGLTSVATAVQDPCDSVSGQLGNPVVRANCSAQGLPANFVQTSPLINIASGGNPELKPESSHNFSAGAVLTPQAAKGLSVSVDYYRYNITNAINSLADADANFIPDTCYTSVDLSSPLCALITRTATGPNTGQINRIYAPDANLDAIFTDGIDVAIGYKHAFTQGTSLTVNWQSNYLFNYIVDSEGIRQQYAGHFSSLVNVGSYTRFRSLLATTVQTGPWTFGWRARFIGAANVLDVDPTVTPYTSAPAMLYNDLVASYRLGHYVFTLGVDNVTDTKPPVLLDGISNTNFNTYDIDGAFVYFRVSASF
jgi:iron complex outermembrane recepter protein